MISPLAVLTKLENKYKVTEAILRESKAGLAVGKLRQHASKDVADIAKEIVKKWKTQVEKAKLANGTKVQPPTGKASPAGTPMSPVGSSAAFRTSKTDGVKAGTGDNTRDKCIELLYDGLAMDSGAPIEQILKRAQSLEKTVYNNHNGNVNAEYKNKMRTLFVNLKVKNNPGLRESVVSGELSVEKLSTTTSQDMASEERKAADQKIKAENFHKSLAAGEQQAETDAFQCGRCKQKCYYRQAQTRRADEPMTVSPRCANCGNRWKFS
ncbi:hypothetical protein DXG01_008644 [Tephrocybe rancida]|nr:hypothetical protein DXG01_008644 [Tephrocybe rancida]